MNTEDSASPPVPDENSRGADVCRLVAVALGYAFTLKLALFLPEAKGVLAAVWPPGGVGLAALLLSPPRLRWAILVTIFVVGNAVNLLSGRPGLASIGFMVANVLESWGCLWLMTRWCGANRVTFARIGEVQALVVCATAVNGVTALIGAAAAQLATHEPFHEFYAGWWVADGLGILLVTPVVVVCAKPWKRSVARFWPRLVEAVALGLVWVAFAWFGFLGAAPESPFVPRPYWIFAPLVWAALRFGTRSTALLLALLAVVAIGLTVSGQGEFPLGGGNALDRLRMVQLFLGVAALTGLALAASVAERKESQAALRRSEEQLALTLDQAQLAHWEIDAASTTFIFNDRFYALYGTTAEREGGYRMTVEVYAREFLPPEEQHIVAADVARLLTGEIAGIQALHHIRRRDGELRHIAVTINVVRDDAGCIVGTRGVNQDITERKRAEEQISHLATEMRVILGTLSSGVARLKDRRVQSANLAFDQMFGYAPGGTIGLDTLTFYAQAEDCARVGLEGYAALAGGEIFRAEVEMRRADRSLFPCSISGRAIDPQNPAAGSIWEWEDITERRRTLHDLHVHQTQLAMQNEELRRAQAELSEARARYFDLYDLAPVGYVTVSEAGLILEANLTAATLLGVARSALVKWPLSQFVLKESQDTYYHHRKRLLETGEPQTCELQMAMNDGATFWASLAATAVQDTGDVTTLRIVLKDITERKLVEQALTRSEQKFRALFDSTGNAVMLLDQKGFLDCNQATLQLMGCSSREEFCTKHPADLSPPQQPGGLDSLPLAQAHIAAAMATGSQRFEWVHRRADTGVSFPASVLLSALQLEGRTVVEAVVHDITERKQAEAEIHELQAFLLEVQRIARLAGWKANPHTDYLEWTSGVFDILEVPPSQRRQPGLAEGLKFYLPEYIPVLRDSIARCLATGERFAVECQGITGAGRTIWTEVRGIASMVEGKHAYVVGTFQDITERKLAEVALTSSVSLLNATLESTADGILVVDLTGRIKRWNQKFAEMWRIPEAILASYDDKLVLNYVLGQLAHPEEFLAKVKELYQQPEASVRDEVDFADGRVFSRCSQPQRIGTAVVGRVWSVSDITESKRVAERLQQSEQKFRLLLHSTAEGIYGVDRQGNCTFANPACCRMLGYAQEEDLLGRHIHTLMHHTRPDGTPYPASECRLYHALKDPAGAHVDDECFWHRDGSSFPVEYWAHPIIHNGQIVGAVAAFFDITERRQAEAKVRELLEQTQRDAHTKAELLKEVNHRVKNNLMAIVGLATTEQRQLSVDEKPLVRGFIDNLRRRIGGLLEVHQMLSTAQWAPLPVNQIARNIIRSALAAAPASCAVTVDLRPSEVKVSPRQASNLGLVFNELATNTVKYALANRTTAAVTFVATATESLIRLEYRDDGPGFPPEVLRQERLSVGMILIRDLTTQTLRGQLTIANDHGAVTVLEIKTEEVDRT